MVIPVVYNQRQTTLWLSKISTGLYQNSYILRVNIIYATIIVQSLLMVGCASPSIINRARASFYRSNFNQAAIEMENTPVKNTDKVLFLMERGTIWQIQHKYTNSINDWLRAQQLAKELDYYSISKTSTSMIINDNVISFRGAPYERVLLHAFTAKSYMALSMWDDAAVEARNIVSKLENRNGFPDDPYSRYLSGFCFEMAGDYEGAALQYRTVSKLLKNIYVDEYTGHIKFVKKNKIKSKLLLPASRTSPITELVCFIAIGNSSGMYKNKNNITLTMSYAEIYNNNKYLGRSYPLTNIKELIRKTRKQTELKQEIKTATRIALKENIANAIADKNEILGELLRSILLAMETPDTRRWKTLPLWLHVARVKCPREIKKYKIIFRGKGGRIICQKTVTEPLSHHRNIFFSFCRDL